MIRRPLSLVCATIVTLSGVACEDDDTEAQPGHRIDGVQINGREAPAQTPDGLDIVFANPTAAGRAADDRRREGEEQRRQRERENLIREPNAPDPHGGSFTLEEAVVDMPLDGQLVAEFNTDLGTFFCDLYADRAPNTVANFIGLARGKRAFWDARAGQWINRRAFDNTSIHRVIPGFMIQGGDYLDDGTGTVGYFIDDEIHESLQLHDRAGMLCMAPSEPNENGAHFFITDGPATHLDGSYTIFGQCRPEEIIGNIARVPQTGEPDNRPLTPVIVEQVRIRRVEGGAAVARRTPPQAPPDFNPEVPGRGASQDPIGLRNARERRIQELREAGRLPPGVE